MRGVLSKRQAATFASLLFALCALTVVTIGKTQPLSLHTAVAFFVLVPLALAALIDSVCHILPDPLLLAGVVIASISLSFASWVQITTAIASATAFLALGIVLSRITSLGRGDAKLMGVLGLWLASPTAVFAALFLAFSGAGIFALVLLVRRRAQLQSAIALGPWLIVGGFGMYMFMCLGI
ncbi:MAG: prepilin peptidase [Actinomycetaceae bacterium]|nr:prepilin peptidase [Actinomycetaceae bacterium]